jgi:hypothetical protein
MNEESSAASLQKRLEYEANMANSRFQNMLLVNGLWLVSYVTLVSQSGDPGSLDSVFKKSLLFLIALAGTTTTCMSSAAVIWGYRVIDNIYVCMNAAASLSVSSSIRTSKIVNRSHIAATYVFLAIMWIFLGFHHIESSLLKMIILVVVPTLGIALAGLAAFRKLDERDTITSVNSEEVR